MKEKVHMGVRLFFGVAFIVFGFNGFFSFLPNPTMSEKAGSLLQAFAATGYFFPMIKAIELFTGLLLVFNTFAPFACILITPVMIGITTIHLFLNPDGLPMMLALHLMHGYLIYGYQSYYRGLFASNAKSFS